MTDAALVIFDLAGTTVDDGDAVNHALRDALAGAGGVTVGFEAINRFMGITKPLVIRSLLVEAGESDPPPDRVEAIHGDFVSRMLAFYRNSPGLRPMAGASEVFQTLREAGVHVGIDTGFSRPIAEAVMARMGWLDEGWISASVTSDEVPRGRPHPDLALALMNRLGVDDPQRVAKVGDTPSDLGEGTAAGCRWVVGFTGGTHSREQLRNCPHTHLIDRLDALPAILGLRGAGGVSRQGQQR